MTFTVSPNEIFQDLRKRPFEPFRLQISDGTQCMVRMASVVIGVPPDPTSTLYEHTLRIDCRHIVKQFPLPPQSAPARTARQRGEARWRGEAEWTPR
jgi:hypothetical protein